MHLGQPPNCEGCQSLATMLFKGSPNLMQCQIHGARLMTFGLFYQIIYYNRQIDQAIVINLSHANFGLNFSIFICFPHFYSSSKVKGSRQKGIKKIGSKSQSIPASSSIFPEECWQLHCQDNWQIGVGVFRCLLLREVFMQMQLGSQLMDSREYAGN